MSKTLGRIIKEPPPPSTNKVILDYLLYLSIQSRLKQDTVLLDDDERAVESIVAGILSTSHASDHHNDCRDTNMFQQRLHLCHLTHTMGHPRCLMDAIPWFLKTSADLLRRILDLDDQPVLFFAGQKDMGAGMPSRWYDLFLSLLTQAAIQNSHSGKELIVEIFSYGMVHDDDDDDEEADADDYYDDDDDDEDYNEQDMWNVKAADYHLLFPKTRTMFVFKAQVREREKEFLEGQGKKDAMQKLIEQYPFNVFQNDMREFIQTAFKSMDEPILDKYDGPTCDGSLLIPGDIDESHPRDKGIVMSSLLVQEAAAVTAIASASASSFKRAYESEDEEEDKSFQKKTKH